MEPVQAAHAVQQHTAVLCSLRGVPREPILAHEAAARRPEATERKCRRTLIPLDDSAPEEHDRGHSAADGESWLRLDGLLEMEAWVRTAREGTVPRLSEDSDEVSVEIARFRRYRWVPGEAD